MILFDSPNSLASMAICTEGKSIPAFDHISCSDMARSPPAEVNTFVPSMVAMLTDAYPTDLSSPTNLCRYGMKSPYSVNHITNIGEQEDIPENVFETANPGQGNSRRNSNELINNGLPSIPRKSRDILLSQQKSLPDINCFTRDQTCISRTLGEVIPMSISDDDERSNFFHNRNSSNDSLASLCIDTETYSHDESDHDSPVFTDLTVSRTKHTNRAGKWVSNCNGIETSGMDCTDSYSYFEEYSPEYSQEPLAPVKVERPENRHCDQTTAYGSIPLNEKHSSLFRTENRKISDSIFHDKQIFNSRVQLCQRLPTNLDANSIDSLQPNHCKSDSSFNAGVKIENPYQIDSLHGFYPVAENYHISSEHESTTRSSIGSDIYFTSGVSEVSNIVSSAISSSAHNGMLIYSSANQGDNRHSDIPHNLQSSSYSSAGENLSVFNSLTVAEKQNGDYFSDEPISCLEIENLVGPCMEEMKGIILNEVVKDVEVACKSLELSPDPQLWSEDQVEKWVVWTISQYSLPFLDSSLFRIKGSQLCKMSEEQMRSIAPKCGDFLHAHLEIWKTVVETTTRDNESFFINFETTKDICKSEEGENRTNSKNSTQHPFEYAREEKSSTKKEPSVFANYAGYVNEGRVELDENSVTTMTPNHTAGIHLWQFLKELLLQPHLYGQYIRWMDKQNGIFKIEDSVEVARLWGIRKNRPAMNYDKLSRSIRQYYKKGIIKKTEVSQRLVYQFVKPIV
ncbi:uncharacterized protein LOC144431411 [Styela clava]